MNSVDVEFLQNNLEFQLEQICCSFSLYRKLLSIHNNKADCASTHISLSPHYFLGALKFDLKSFIYFFIIIILKAIPFENKRLCVMWSDVSYHGNRQKHQGFPRRLAWLWLTSGHCLGFGGGWRFRLLNWAHNAVWGGARSTVVLQHPGPRREPRSPTSPQPYPWEEGRNVQISQREKKARATHCFYLHDSIQYTIGSLKGNRGAIAENTDQTPSGSCYIFPHHTQTYKWCQKWTGFVL